MIHKTEIKNHLDGEIRCIKSGNWNDPSIWDNNQTPTIHDRVVIDAGFIVTLSNSISAYGIMVMGTLRPESSFSDFDITTQGIAVMGGLFEIGTLADPYLGNAKITLIGSDKTQILFEEMPAMGCKFVGAMNGGTIRMHGINKKSWTKLTENATVGSTKIKVEDSLKWQIGDEILIVSSRLNWNEAEKRTISAIDPETNLVSFNEPLLYPHSGTTETYIRPTDNKTWAADLRAEVGMLSHNIKIQGDDTSDENGFGGHIMIHNNGYAYIENIELYQMGQKSIKGRYPMHWHMLAGLGAGQYFKNNSVHKSYNRATTIHGTHKVLVENNFMYDHIGHGIFLEEGSEINNTINGNVVLLTKKPLPGEELTPSDNSDDEPQNRTPSSFWITNPNNYFTNNIAAGTEGTGFWYALPQDFMFLSKDNPLFGNQEKPNNEVLGSFSGNTAHSTMNGFDIFDQLDENHAILKNNGWTGTSPKYFENNTWYANDIGIYSGIGGGRSLTSLFTFKNNIFVENKVALMVANYSTIDESVFVANSSQNLIEGERYLYTLYDGAGTVKNSHFVGWNEINANFLTQTGAATKHVNHVFENITFNHQNPVRISLTDLSKTLAGYADINDFLRHPRAWSFVLSDKTGSLSGLVNSSIIPNHPFVAMGDEIKIDNWKNVLSTHRHYGLAISRSIPQQLKAIVSREKPGTTTESVYYINGYLEKIQLPVIVNEDFIYTYNYESLDGVNLIFHEALDLSPGDSYIVRYKDFGKLIGLVTIPLQSDWYLPLLPTLDLLKISPVSCFYVEPLGDMYIKIVANRPDQKFSIAWGDDYIYKKFKSKSDVDGDGVEDKIETNQNRIPESARDLRFDFSNAKLNNFATIILDANTSWVANGMTPIIEPNSKSWKSTLDNTSNAYFGRGDLAFRANDVPSILVDIKSERIGRPKLYWTTQSEPDPSEDKSIVLSYDTQNQRNILYFDLSNHPKWKNQTISTLALIPPADSGQIELFSIYSGNYDSDGDGTTDHVELKNNRNPKSASDLEYDFSEKNLDWFSGIDITEICKGCNNAWEYFTLKEYNNQFHKNEIAFDANEVPHLYVDLESETTGDFKINWTTESGTQYYSINSVNYTTESGRALLHFDLSNHPNWINNKITSLVLTFPGKLSKKIKFYSIHTGEKDTDGDGMIDSEEYAKCRKYFNENDFGFNFDESWSSESKWISSNIRNFSISNGKLSGTSNGDSYFYHNKLFDFYGNKVQKLYVKIKSDISSEFTINWSTENSVFSSQKSITKSYTGDGKWQIIEFDLSNHLNWNVETIKDIRFGLGSQLNVNFEIDWIRAQEYNECDFKITLSQNPLGGGLVTGDGKYKFLDKVTLKVTPRINHSFINWTTNEEVLSDNPEYDFIFTDTSEIIANFSEINSIKSYPFYVYPSPAKANLTIGSHNSFAIKQIEIFDMMGNSRMTNKNLAKYNKLDVSQLASGIYIIRIISEDGSTINYKFYKE